MPGEAPTCSKAKQQERCSPSLSSISFDSFPFIPLLGAGHAWDGCVCAECSQEASTAEGEAIAVVHVGGWDFFSSTFPSRLHEAADIVPSTPLKPLLFSTATSPSSAEEGGGGRRGDPHELAEGVRSFFHEWPEDKCPNGTPPSPPNTVNRLAPMEGDGRRK